MTGNKIRPLHDRVIVKRLPEEDVTKGGIIIPDSAKEKPIQGEVCLLYTSQPTSLDYRSLLCAAEDILKQRIEENDRASQNYVTNYLTLAASLGGPARRF